MAFTRYIRAFGRTFVLCVCAFSLLVLFQIGGPTRSSVWIDEVYRIKTSLALSEKEPQLVLVGGSDVLFGISCQMIHEGLDIPCTNLGTHAGLGPDYLTYAAKPVLKPGDTALLSVPYLLYRSQGKPRRVLIDYIFAHDPHYLRSRDSLSVARFFTGITFDRIARGYAAKISPRGEDPFALYQSENLNQYGDETINLQADVAQQFVDVIAELMPEPYINGAVESSYGMDRLRAFANWCKQQNVRLLVTYPNALGFDEYKEEGATTFFQSIEDFHKSLDVPVLGTPQDFLYDKSVFFDTDYHLNERGVRERTQTLITMLSSYF